MLPSGFTETCQLEENSKLWFPSRFEWTVLLGQVFLANHCTEAPPSVVLFYLFCISGSRPFFPVN